MKPEKGEKEIFYFSYDMNNGRLTHLKDKRKETKELDWASVSPDGKTVVYAKDLNLYRMSREDYEKLKKNEKDSTITEIQITTDGVKDFGYGQPYSLLNTDTLCNGKRKAVWGTLVARLTPFRHASLRRPQGEGALGNQFRRRAAPDPRNI